MEQNEVASAVGRRRSDEAGNAPRFGVPGCDAAPPPRPSGTFLQQRGPGFPGCRLELRSHHALSSLLSCLLPPPPFPLGRQATRPK